MTMYSKSTYLVIVIVFVIFGEGDSEEAKEMNSNRTSLKIFFQATSSRPNWIHFSGVKPTASIVEHEPGVPPGWSKPPKTTTRRPGPQRIQVPEVTEMLVESQMINITNTTGVENPNKAGVVDWFLGVIGVKPEEPQQPIPQGPPSKNCPKCVCGVTYKHTRIVGGVETQVNEYPWMTALMYNNRFYCGASLINNKYLLTAAHCVNGFNKDKLMATFLDHDRSNTFESKTFTRKIRSIYRHRYYGTGGNYNNDIAILQLDAEIPITGLIKPVCLPQIGKSYTGYKGIATGWGATQEHGQVSNKLREVEVPIMSNNNCRKTGYSSRITDNMMCAGFAQGMKDSCQGDSGGPLHVVNGSYHSIVGIVSWGEGCAEANFPGVYTRVNRYVSWIKSNTRDACYC